MILSSNTDLAANVAEAIIEMFIATYAEGIIIGVNNLYVNSDTQLTADAKAQGGQITVSISKLGYNKTKIRCKYKPKCLS